MKRTPCLLNSIMILLIMSVSGCGPKLADKDFIPIPSGAPLYVSISNLEQDWEGFQRTEFMTSMKALKIWEEPKIKAGLDKFSLMLKEIEEESGIPMNQQTFMSIFGKRVDFALISGATLPQIVFTADLGMKATVLKILDIVFQEYGTGERELEKYQGVEITLLPVQPPMKLAYLFHGDRLILTSDLATARNCVDMLLGNVPTLFESEEYQAAEKNNPMLKEGNVVFLDAERTIRLLKSFSPEISGAMGGDPFGGMQQLSMAWKWTGNGFQGHSDSVYSQDNPLFEVFGDESEMQSAAKWLPDGALIASAGAVKFDKILDYQHRVIAENLKEGDEDPYLKAMDYLKTNHKIDVEQELKSWAGSGAFFSVNDLNMQGMFPIPESVLGFSLKDTEKARKFMTRMESLLTDVMAEKHIEFMEKTVMDMTCRYIPLPLGPSLSPGYIVTDDFLLLGTSSSAMETVIKTAQGSSSRLMTSDEFKSLALQPTSSDAGFQYVNTERILEKLAELVDYYRMFIAEAANPDDVKSMVNSLRNIQGYYASFKCVDNRFQSDLRLTLK